MHAHKQSRRMVTEELDRGASEVPQHLTLQKSALSAVVNGIVNRADIQLTVNELLIVEFYSRKVGWAGSPCLYFVLGSCYHDG